MICTKCKIDKENNMFYKTTINKSGFRGECKECSKNTCQKTRLSIKSKKIKHKKCEFCSTELGIDIKLTSNICKSKECKKERIRKYAKDNAPKMCAISAKRHASKLQATPPWLTKEHFEQIESFYEVSSIITKQTDVPHQVDHIIPLQGEIVSGLHVPWNLQVITKEENLKKGNRI